MRIRNPSWKSLLLGAAAPIAVAVTALAPTGAWAQAASGQSTLEEVVVVARKREESLQSVPVAVSAIQGENLARLGVKQPSDLSKLVPSLTITGENASTPSGAIISLRGQAASDVLPTLSQPVGLYEDSVNIPHPVGSNIGFFDIQRVEVLKGPQGTLYGRNTTGGAVNIITRGADYSGIHGFAYGEYGNHSDWKLAGAVNVPIIPDVLAGRIAYQHWDREGYGKSAITGEHLGGSHDDDVVRGSLKFDPLPTVSVIGKLEYFHADRTDALYQTRVLTAPGLADLEWQVEGAIGGVPPSQLVNRGDLFTNYSQQRSFEKLKGWHGALDASWDITDTVRLRSITGYHQFKDFRDFDLDAMPLTVVEVGFGPGFFKYPVGLETRPVDPDEESRQWTQEFNLSGNAFDNRFNWLVGAFYANDKANASQRTSTFPPVLTALNPANPFGGPFDAQYHSLDIGNTSWALFTQNDIKFSDVFSVTAGLRYTEEKLDQDVAATIFLLGTGPIANRWTCISGPVGLFPTEAGCVIHQNAKFSGTSYLLSFNFQFTPDTLLYVKTARGFRGGALQVRAPTFPAASPEIATDYEVGLKTDLFEKRLRANLAAYQTNYDNKQETAIIVLNGVQSTPIVNAATARIRGFEAELTAVPIENLSLSASATYLDGQYLSYPHAITPLGLVNASGAAFANPKWATHIGARYVIPGVGPGDIGIQANYSWHSKFPTTVINNDPSIPPALVAEWRKSLGLLDASIDYTMKDQGLTFALFATNLTDEKYQSQALTFNSSSLQYGFTGTTQEPLMWGVSVRKTFGAE